MSQFKACITDYYGWTKKAKTICLDTSIVGNARKTLCTVSANNWAYGCALRQMKVYGQIQTELLTHSRKPRQVLHDYHDEIAAVSQTANMLKRSGVS